MADKDLKEGKVADFTFISDERFRDSLSSDYLELLGSLNNGAWKAAHVLAGSVVEALLIDYLVSLDYKKRHNKDPLEFDLSKAVAACKSEGVLSERAADLSTVIRGYRNLIHPGRIFRLKESVDRNSATVAKALVDIVITEVSAARKEKYGLTAEQIIQKIESDSSAIPILPHLLRETSEYERERLARLLPDLHFRHSDDGFYSTTPLEICFRQVFDLLPDEKKTSVARRFVSILKQQPEDEVLNYETAFFRATDMRFLPANEVAIVREHLLSQMKSPTMPKLDAVRGLGQFVEEIEVPALFGNLIRAVLHDSETSVRREAQFLLTSEYWGLKNDDLRKKAISTVETWKTYYERKGNSETATRVRSIIEEMQEEVPF